MTWSFPSKSSSTWNNQTKTATSWNNLSKSRIEKTLDLEDGTPILCENGVNLLIESGSIDWGYITKN